MRSALLQTFGIMATAAEFLSNPIDDRPYKQVSQPATISRQERNKRKKREKMKKQSRIANR